MKKVICIMLALSISGLSFARKGGDKRTVPSLANDAIAKSRKDQKSQLRSFATRRYGAVTHRHGIHIFGHGHSGGAAKPESGLGL